MILDDSYSLRFPQTLTALKLTPYLGLFSAMFSLLVMLGYQIGFEPLFMPLTNGPGTHPMSAIMIFVLGLCTVSWRPFSKKKIMFVCAGSVALLAGIRMAEIATAHSLLYIVTPFTVRLAEYAKNGQPISTGFNTALMLLLQASALMLATKGRHYLSQIVAFLAIGIPLVAITGYAYGIDEFYGRMALTTAVGGISVGFAILFASAHRGVLRVLLSPWIGGKIARIQIVLGFLVPFLIGYLLLLISTRHADEFLGLFVILISIFVSAMVAYSAAFQEKVDYDRRKAERELKSAAMRDPLTSLYNRGFFFHSGVLLLQRAVRNRENLTALMIDIDHFKNINDNFGHQAGDVVLRRVAQAIAETVRKQDLAGRYGGEEFAVLLPDTDMIGARRLAEKLRHNVSELCFPSVGRVTISVGCALWHESDNLTSLLEAADKHLYVAKATGRNRVAG